LRLERLATGQMDSPAKLVVTNSAGARQALTELVMAWARDTETGQPRYILELDAEHRGAKCGCECPNCGKPLTAVNAAKTEFVRRPHFRHPEGAPRDECLVLAARAAVLRQMLKEGWIDLPRRRITGRVAGLSGEYHEAWVEQPAARLRISDVTYRDSANALVTFDDGRQLVVQLTGTSDNGGTDESGARQIPTIYLAIDDPALASMSPEELMQRARLLPTDVCWKSHWDDSDLQVRADDAARALAHRLFEDLPPDFEFPDGLDASLRRETVLHFEVKKILAEAGRLTVPGVVLEDEVPGSEGKLVTGSWIDEEEELRLYAVELEARYGRLVPDITCEAFGADGHARYLPLLIEVTVTNPIGDERLTRIRQTGEATLEIDLSLAGGRINRDELRSLVIDETAIKRWVFREDIEPERARLRASLLKQAADQRAQLDAYSNWVADRRRAVLAMPIAEVVAEYIGAVTRLLDYRGDTAGVLAAREAVSDAANKLSIRGFSEAGDEQLVDGGGLLASVLSIQLRRPVGYRLPAVIDVLKLLRRHPGRRTTCSVYFIAAKAFSLELDADDQLWFEEWAAEVRQSIRAGETKFLRDPFYDRLLSLAFPEMASALSKPLGKLAPSTGIRWDNEQGVLVRPVVPERRPAKFLATQPRSDRAGQRLLDTKPGQWWLQGRDLEAWKREHPDAAQAWFPNSDRDKA
jgi:hypothetical protein